MSADPPADARDRASAMRSAAAKLIYFHKFAKFMPASPKTRATWQFFLSETNLRINKYSLSLEKSNE